MKRWKNKRIVVVLALVMLSWACDKVETKVFRPKPLDSMKEVQVSEESKKLDAEVLTFFRDQFSIKSAHYYLLPGEIPWIAFSKSVQNQMAEKLIRRTVFDWYEPGIDFIEVYPQGNNDTVFAVAMPKGTNPSADKLIGFYVLTAHK
jgi:hypothetical protein